MCRRTNRFQSRVLAIRISIIPHQIKPFQRKLRPASRIFEISPLNQHCCIQNLRRQMIQNPPFCHHYRHSQLICACCSFIRQPALLGQTRGRVNTMAQKADFGNICARETKVGSFDRGNNDQFSSVQYGSCASTGCTLHPQFVEGEASVGGMA